MEVKQYSNFDRHVEIVETKQNNATGLVMLALVAFSTALVYLMIKKYNETEDRNKH